VFAIYSFVQAAVPDVGEPSHALLYFAGLIVVGLMGWVVKVTRDVSRAITRLTDCLFGYTGTNGLNRDVEQLREDVDRLLDRRNAWAAKQILRVDGQS
jgi:hypothetical protein